MMPIPKKNDRIAVFGLGRSSLAVLRYARQEGIEAFAYDGRPEAETALQAAGLSGVPFFSGEDYRKMPRADFLFRAPALRPDHPVLSFHRARGGVLTDEISLFAALCPAKIFAVTGSDGKSTTATLIYEALRLAGKRAYLGGNIGRSLLPYLSEMRDTDFAVLELSSFQLMTASLSAEGGVITNLSPNHLNWHTDMAEYAAAKARLFESCREMTVRKGLFPEREALRFSIDAFSGREQDAPLHMENGLLYDEETPLFHERDMRLCGRFHLENLLAAAGATRPFVPRSLFSRLAREFRGLPHRLEYLGTYLGHAFYNSSIDTSPLRTLQSLSALKEKGLAFTVLLGGAQKGLSLSPLVEALPSLAASAVLFGESREGLRLALTSHLPLATAEDLKGAVSEALALTEGTKQAIVLSPAFTAFDAFRDYEARGEAFRQIFADLSK